MIIAKNDCTKIEIHETVYGKKKTLRIRSQSGRDREIDFAILEITGEDEDILFFGFQKHSIQSVLAAKYYQNIKSSLLKTFALKGG